MGSGSGKMNMRSLGNVIPKASSMAYMAPDAPTVVQALRYMALYLPISKMSAMLPMGNSPFMMR